MSMRKAGAFIAVVAAVALAAGTWTARAMASDPAPVPVPLSSLYDNNGIGVAPGDANVDGSHYGFPASELPSGSVTIDGVPYDFPATTGAGQDDNAVALGQTVAVPSGRYVLANLLITSTYGSTSGAATVHYADGTTSTAAIGAPDWYSGGNGGVNADFRYSPSGNDNHPVHIYVAQVWIDPSRTATSITLPTTAAPAPNVSSMHVFALTLQPAVEGQGLMILDAKSTTRRMQTDQGGTAQVMDVTVLNTGDRWIVPGRTVTVAVRAPGVDTVAPATVRELGPGEEARLEVGIRSPGVDPGTQVDGTVVASGEKAGIDARRDVRFAAGIPAYAATDASLSQHQAPDWFDNAKFGIFIHWGVYSVPAWGPVGQEYAEWYWQHMNDPNDPTYQYHLQHYGKDFNYDDFIPKFTADRFDPKQWVQLFRAAGAKYFVLTSKHHEGFSLFDSKVTNRTSVKMGPHQDLVRKLFDADRKYTPDIHPGVYYSLPEWYNPADPWYGHGPQNPYTGQPVPYTGYIPVQDYVHDYQVPQLEELIHNYKPDVIWCDIGTPATERSVLRDYFNQALQDDQEVTVDNRCGLPDSDFSTPEYATYNSLVTSKWESSRGLDPRSYGYNSATPDDAYATADQLVDQLADIVSKNGNFLLDIGPKADGTIPQIMQTRLRQMGDWLRVNGESVYGTTYWLKQQEAGDLRFSVDQNKAFYITSLKRPGDRVVVDAPVPIKPSDTVTMLGYPGGALHWSRTDDGKLVIDVPPDAQSTGDYAWVFKVNWGG